MSHNILITGGSGYLGGTVLACWGQADLPAYSKLYALVRSSKQAQAVKQYGAEPLFLNLDNHDEVVTTIVDKSISIVYYLIDVYYGDRQMSLLEGLGRVRESTGWDVHFLHTGGAKQFSSHVGMPTDQPFSDMAPNLYYTQKKARGLHQFLSHSVKVNCDIVDRADALGVRSYIFIPCVVYGEGTGFGNKVSIQDAAIVQAAEKLRQVSRVDPGTAIWPVCHVLDTAGLYLHILRKILSREEIGCGRNGYYLASSGPLAWNQIYEAFAAALAKRGVIDSNTVQDADQATLCRMGEALNVEPSTVPVLLGGNCLFFPEHGREIGWTPRYGPEHLLEVADSEVDLILADLKTSVKASIR